MPLAMFPPAAQIPLRRGASALHVYRHLLREASYLPPVIAPFFLDHIKSRFHRRHEHKKPDMARKRMANARRWLRFLQEANAGYSSKMHKLFSYSFGRIGHLRHKLMDRILLPDAASDPASESTDDPSLENSTPKAPSHAEVVDEVRRLRSFTANKASRGGQEYIPPKTALELARMDTKLKRNFLDRWDFDKIKWYMQSVVTQYSHSRPASFTLHSKVAKSEPVKVIPATNAWERPTPLREIRSKLKRFFRVAMPMVPPPLGVGEWEKLRSLASGQGASPLLASPPRRPTAVSSSPDMDGSDSDDSLPNWEQRIVCPSRELVRLGRTYPEEFPDMAGLGKSANARPLGGAKRNRRLRRVCERVFEASAMLREDEHTLKKSPVWGRIYKPVPTATSGALFFSGVDAAGSVSHSTIPEK